MRFLAAGLPTADAARAKDYADFIDAPHARARNWPKDARSRTVAAEGLARLAKRSPDAAAAQLATLQPVLGFDEAQRGQVLYQVALWTVASYLPGSATRLAAVPASAYDDRLHEWRVREAMNRGDDGAAVRALEAMGATQRGDPRWQYFEARLRERLGQHAAAKAHYTRAAKTSTFHGFLAADRLAQPYALCPLEPSGEPALRRRVAAEPGLARAIELFRIDRIGPATREWTALLEDLDDAAPRCRPPTTSARASTPTSSRRPPAGMTAPCSRSARNPTISATIRCASRCITKNICARKRAGTRSIRRGSPGRRAPRARGCRARARRPTHAG